jgi:hypothetical protein
VLCLVALAAGCRSGDEPTLGPLPPKLSSPRLERIAPGHSPQWTAEGRIVYVDIRDGDVWSVRPNGQARRHLVSTKTQVGLLASPDRTRMLLLRTDRNRIARTDGSRLRPISAVSQASTGRWSDDGTMITFPRLNGSRRSIWAVPARGGPPRRLFGEFGGVVLAWAADGRMVVRAFQERAGGSFAATLLFGPEGEPTELPSLLAARFLPNGAVEGIDEQGTLVQLDGRGGILRRFPGSDPISELPDYSPDRRLMVYEQGGQLWIASGSWTAPRVLANAPCYQPSFSPDGSRVVCALFRTNGEEGEHRKATRYVAVIGVPPELR